MPGSLFRLLRQVIWVEISKWIRNVAGLIAFFLFLFPDAFSLGLLIFESIEERLEHSRNFEHNTVKDSQSHDQKPPRWK